MIGFVGSGNMASAIARGLGEPILCSDAYPEKARQLAAELGGEAIEGNGLLADRADLVGQRPRALGDDVGAQHRPTPAEGQPSGHAPGADEAEHHRVSFG